MNTSYSSSPRKLATLILGFSLAALVSGQASAAGKKNTTQASVLSETTCAITDDPITGDPKFEVTTTLTDISSGGAIPLALDGTEIKATYKPANKRGNTLMSFPETVVPITDPAEVNPELTLTASFDLCDESGGVREEVQNARELNASSTVIYGSELDPDNTRTVTNRCVDGGIGVDDALLDFLKSACQ